MSREVTRQELYNLKETANVSLQMKIVLHKSISTLNSLGLGNINLNGIGNGLI